MRMLYLPREGRTSPATEAALRRSIQDTIRVDPQSRMNAAFNPVVIERERLLGMLRRMDTRPWQADVRSPGSAVLADREDDVPFDEMLFGLPSKWRLVQTDEHPLQSLVTATGQTLAPADIDRAVRHRGRLLLQKDAEMWQATGPQAERIEPAEDGVLPPLSAGQCLVSLDEHTYDLLPAAGDQTVEINHSLNGLSVETETTGDIEVEVNYVSTRYFSSAGTYSLGDVASSEYVYVVTADGQIVETSDSLLVILSGEGARPATMGDFLAAGQIIDDSGDQVSYEIDNINNTITIARAGTLYYNTRHLRDVRGQKTGTQMSFADLSSRMFAYPKRQDVTVYQRVQPLCEVPGQTSRVELERTGRVGEARVAHPISAVLPGLFHVLVAGNDNDGYLHVSLVEHNTGAVRMTQRFETRTLAGLTWTDDGEVAVLEATDSGILTHVLEDVRDQQAAGITPASEKRSSIPDIE
jgi:hypothetical protein